MALAAMVWQTIRVVVGWKWRTYSASTMKKSLTFHNISHIKESIAWTSRCSVQREGGKGTRGRGRGRDDMQVGGEGEGALQGECRERAQGLLI